MEMEKKEREISIAAVIEAALFLSSEPLSLAKMKKICEATEKEINNALKELKAELEEEKRGLVLLETPEGYQLGTKPEVAGYLEKLFDEDSSAVPLSQAALETLAIIACKQPVTRMEIENIRGVKAEGVIDNLLKRGLIQVSGRKEGLGRPFLYSTTDIFLQYFGLKDLTEIEPLKEELDTIFPKKG